MIFCKDCRHFGVEPGGHYYVCKHPDGSPRSVIYGYVKGIIAATARAKDGFCGPSGKAFELRPPTWWERLWGIEP